MKLRGLGEYSKMIRKRKGIKRPTKVQKKCKSPLALTNDPHEIIQHLAFLARVDRARRCLIQQATHTPKQTSRAFEWYNIRIESAHVLPQKHQ